MPPDNIFDRQFFGDLAQFDTTTAFVRVIIEPTVAISDILSKSLAAQLIISFVTYIKDTLTMTTRVKQDLSFTTRIRDVEDVSV